MHSVGLTIEYAPLTSKIYFAALDIAEELPGNAMLVRLGVGQSLERAQWLSHSKSR